jgi:hypothetical protein
MTDGAWNIGTHNPLEYILPANGGTAAAGTSLLDKKVELFAVGYGVTGHSDVNPTVLSQLAAGSYKGGQVRRPDEAALTATQVASAFRDAIKAGITPASSPGDPTAVFHAGQSEARHFAVISDYDRKVAFVLSWNTPDAKRMRLELITPTCDLITPETAGQGPFRDITFRGSRRSQMYMVGPDFLHNNAEPNRPRYGTWTLRVLSPELSDSGEGLENYDYDIIVDSDLRMVLKLDRPSYYAGDAIGVSARLTAAGRPIKDAAVVLSTTAPQQSEANWLTGLDVPAEFLKRAAEMVRGDSTAILVKAVAAGLAGIRFPGGSSQTNSGMIDPRGIGTYRATVTDTSTPEMRTFYVTAIGVTEDGVAFRREGKIATNVLVRPDPAYTLIDLDFHEAGLVDVRVTPRDRYGNVLLVDPATAGGFGLIVKDAEFSGPLTSDVSGTYSRQLRYDPTTAPAVAVAFGGNILTQVVVPPAGRLRWVDRVVQFEPGAEAAKGANQHANPGAVLGDVFKKPVSSFVSLGAGGALVVAVNNAVIEATGADDVTVFVAPGPNPGPYRVEMSALFPGAPSRWVTLGVSAGATQSFSLRSAHIESAAAIRITDLSRQTRGADLKPLATPGGRFRGVGVLKVSDRTPATLRAASISFLHISGRTEAGSMLPLPHGTQLNVHTDPFTHDDVNRILIAFDKPFNLDGIAADATPQAIHLDGPINTESMVRFHSDLALAASSHLIVQLTMKNPSSIGTPGVYRLTVFGRPSAGVVPLVATDGGALDGDFSGTPGGSDLMVTFRVSPAQSPP